MPAGDLPGLVKEIQLAKVAVRAAARRAGAELLRSGPGWILAPPVVDRAGRGERGGGLLEHRSQSAGAPSEDGSAGCRQVVGPAPRKRVRNRIQSLLATQGIWLALSAGFVEHLTTVQTGDGRALPTGARGPGATRPSTDAAATTSKTACRPTTACTELATP